MRWFVMSTGSGYGGEGVACFKPEKKARWKHVNARSLFIQGGTCLLSPRLFFIIFFCHCSSGKFQLRGQHLDRSLRLRGSQLDH